MITVTAVQEVRPGMEAQLDELMSGLIDNVKENEPGCVRFDYVRSDDDSNVRLVYEQYRDQLAFEHHKTTPYLHEFIPKLLRCLEKPPQVTTSRRRSSATPTSSACSSPSRRCSTSPGWRTRTPTRSS
jgi:quinol monooxygenase YgiN